MANRISSNGVNNVQELAKYQHIYSILSAVILTTLHIIMKPFTYINNVDLV